VVITPDFESGNLGSNPSGTYFFWKNRTGNMIPTKVDQCNLLEKGQILSLRDHKHQMVPWYSGYHSATWVQIPVGSTFLEKQTTRKYDPNKSRTIQTFGKG
jgi:hypothetical protein